MAVLNPESHPWSRVSIRAHAPNGSGVYAVFSSVWIYVGEGDDIQACLLDHFNGDNPCISDHRPYGFTFEVVPPDERAARTRQLVEELKPVCNPLLPQTAASKQSS